MTSLKAMLVRVGPRFYLKIEDDVVVYCFEIHPYSINYEVKKLCSDHGARPDAELVDL